ncbi:Cytochrome c-type biogenesis protein CcmE [Anaplasma phagocytophilum]|uniref:cytochrome c maturation protein CcmE n=1 Tax=Anaplasma phagocytophilum TaxID=948 RepID=UPI0007E21F5B|nr:cytochrome c maturation protein CcmE [Anaplasma phagocytophilum]SCV61504.1 Cytochrome c-type biogenesis protein CcmE [Anaplasma phagocytophilum]SCV65463.1 Cytochrome c-type biogenesis protein CcmE [Anaplasma phagocytophilum]
MRRKHKRILFVAVSFIALGCVSAFVLFELSKSISFFCTPTELVADPVKSSRYPIRVGGMIVKGSIVRHGDSVTFSITDLETELEVTYRGVLPPMFGEDVGAIVKGRFVDGVFIAEELLAKHDEKYMPKKYSSSDAAVIGGS